ncbi:putative snorna binding protein [Golovinomyces cichoracearum]|uniref:Putative snorna binding protein n=1 Tax=Golovinomyces cichoracearum TaxID=62708 RepID=A0A420J9Z9_9PEZI|nr:putative snorna binding protein [Golovinomyces cichoracearum]
MGKTTFGRNFCGIIQSILTATVIYVIVYVVIILCQRGDSPFPKSAADFYRNSLRFQPGSSDLNKPSTRLSQSKKINVNANWFNRPESLVIPRDDYMGKRPHIDTVANLTRLVHECRGSYEKIERMPFVYDCLKFLQDGEKEYFYLPPPGERASDQPPSRAEYLNSDNKGNTLPSYPAQKFASKKFIGTCNGPIIPYHIYWTGPATWRIELFLKSYLYTQNLPCARLWIWLDGDRNPNAVEEMLKHDPIFEKFLPLVERGDVELKTWIFPSRIPLPPGDNTDGVGYYKSPGKPNWKNETIVAEGLIRDANNQEWLVLTKKQMSFLPVAVSDAVRFVVLHIYGGAYFDTDVIMLRDMRPLLIGESHSFAERWGGHPSPGDYNTAIMSLSPNSSLSSYLLRGGVRMGLNFHPRVIGVMAVKDGRNHELLMMETALFDPIWSEFNRDRLGSCTVPCIHDYGQVFQGSKTAFPLNDEWEAYEGNQSNPQKRVIKDLWDGKSNTKNAAVITNSKAPNEKILQSFDRTLLQNAKYIIEEDNYPPSNRTLENFFRGAWTYHIHNQWTKNPEPSSWLNVLQRAQDGYFSHGRKNPYGEKWNGPEISEYDVSWGFT